MIAAGGPPRFRFSALSGDVNLAADDRFYTLFYSTVVKLHRAEQIAVIGQCQSRHIQLCRPFNHIVEPIRTIKKTVMTVKMKMTKTHNSPTLSYSHQLAGLSQFRAGKQSGV
jgi:hypothetical protein